MGGVWAIARVDLRRRWRSLLVLTLLVALGLGAVLTAFAGGHRGATALERLVDQTRPATVFIDSTEYKTPWEEVEKLPYLHGTARVISAGLLTEFQGDDIAADVITMTPVDNGVFDRIEIPVLIEGRLYEPQAADEAVVTEAFTHTWGKGVGDTVTPLFDDPRGIGMGDDTKATGEPRPRPIDVTIVGVVRSPLYADWPGGSGALVLSPGLAQAYPEHYFGDGWPEEPRNLVALLVNTDPEDRERLRKDVARILGQDDLPIRDLQDERVKKHEILEFEGLSLGYIGLAASLATFFLVGTAIARTARASAGELRTALALGMTPRAAAIAASAVSLVAATVGGVLAVGGATVATRWFPIGTAALIEPDPGVKVYPALFAGGLIVMVAFVALVAVAASSGALRRVRPEGTRRSPAARATARTGMPVPVQVGTRFAFETGRWPRSVPVRSALLGTVLAVAGVTMSIVFGAGVSDAADNPRRFGQTYQIGTFTGFNGQSFIRTPDLERAIAGVEGVTQTSDLRVNIARDPGGRTSVALLAAPPNVDAVVLEGRLPATGGEVLLGPKSLEQLGAEVGDTVTLTGDKATRDLKVVGAGLMPFVPQSEYDQGGWLARDGFEALFKDFGMRLLYVQTADDPEVMKERLTEATFEAMPELAAPTAFAGWIPWEDAALEAQIENIERLPLWLGVFLATLGCAAMAHALAVASRMRNAELATLRALGTTPGQTGALVLTQALATVLFGLVFGVPVGVALGRTLWRVVAASMPAEYVVPATAAALLTVWVGALVAATLMAMIPAWRAVRSSPAGILRTE